MRHASRSTRTTKGRTFIFADRHSTFKGLLTLQQHRKSITIDRKSLRLCFANAPRNKNSMFFIPGRDLASILVASARYQALPGALSGVSAHPLGPSGRSHRFTNSLISCEPADTVESPCGPAHTKQGCLSIRVACAYPNAHGRASSTRAPFGPSRRSSPHAIRACTAFEPARHARDVQNAWFCMARRAKKTALPTFPGLHRLLCLPCLPCLLRLPCHPCLPCLRCFSCPSCLPCLIPVPSASPLPALLAMLCLSCLPCPLYLMCLSLIHI